jgi:hypothetical protein
MSTTTNSAVTCKAGPRGDQVSLSFDTEKNQYDLAGTGSVLGSCPLDCDTARWEVVIGPAANKEVASSIQVGVKRYNKKHPSNLNGSLETTSADAESPSWLLTGAVLKEGDVVGVYWDQTDLPMLSFTLNGKSLPAASVNRIRPSGEIYPAVSLSSGTCSMVFDDDHFRHPSIASKFKMIICSTSLI